MDNFAIALELTKYPKINAKIPSSLGQFKLDFNLRLRTTWKLKLLRLVNDKAIFPEEDQKFSDAEMDDPDVYSAPHGLRQRSAVQYPEGTDQIAGGIGTNRKRGTAVVGSSFSHSAGPSHQTSENPQKADPDLASDARTLLCGASNWATVKAMGSGHERNQSNPRRTVPQRSPKLGQLYIYIDSPKFV
nr:unnamed protein product [Spirometra erinaceieuropaei]